MNVNRIILPLEHIIHKLLEDFFDNFFAVRVGGWNFFWTSDFEFWTSDLNAIHNCAGIYIVHCRFISWYWKKPELQRLHIDGMNKKKYGKKKINWLETSLGIKNIQHNSHFITMSSVGTLKSCLFSVKYPLDSWTKKILMFQTTEKLSRMQSTRRLNDIWRLSQRM